VRGGEKKVGKRTNLANKCLNTLADLDFITPNSQEWVTIRKRIMRAENAGE